MSSDNTNEAVIGNDPAFAVDNDLNEEISSGFNTTSESKTDNSTNDASCFLTISKPYLSFFQGAVASDDSTIGAKRQPLAALQQLCLEPGDSVIFDKDASSRGTFCSGDAEVKLTTNIYDLKTKANNVYIYYIDMEKWFETGRLAGQHFPVVDLRRRISDYTTWQNRQLQQKLLTAFMVKYPNVFGQDYDNFCFDYGNTLYSLIELNNFDVSMSLDPAETRAAIDRDYKATLTVKRSQDNTRHISLHP
uniref:Uncharacterized protein n=1 Tax=Panagrolaimus sp. PS1159 TaxID=55785 RepID=A0AC35EVP0_9BILA